MRAARGVARVIMCRLCVRLHVCVCLFRLERKRACFNISVICLPIKL